MSCGSMKTSVRRWQGHSGRLLDTVNDYDVIDCSVCGFKHVVPIPDEDDLKRYYAEKFIPERPLYMVRMEEDLEWWNTVYDDRYDFLEKCLPRTRRRILDIGCGIGNFLRRGRERGWECLGIEPSKDAASYARDWGLDVINSCLDEARLEGPAFDAIHVSEVLEHIPAPVEFLEKAHGLLHDGGVICVVVPNDYSPIQRLLREILDFKPYWIAPPQHINYFSFDSLERLLKRVGFRILKKTAMFPMDLFLVMGDNYVGNDQLGRACHEKRKRLDIMLNEPWLKGFKDDMYELMAKHGIGREIILYGRKDGAR